MSEHTKRVHAIPQVIDTEPSILPETDALAIDALLRTNNPALWENLQALKTDVTKRVMAELDMQLDDATTEITPRMLRGIVAKSIIAATGQIVHDVGGALADTPMQRKSSSEV